VTNAGLQTADILMYYTL